MPLRTEKYNIPEAATYEEIARAIGLSPERVREICQRALRKLRKRAAARELARLAASRDYSELNLRIME